MRCILKDKDGKKILQFKVLMPISENLAEKLGIPFKEYLIELAKIKLEDKTKRKKKHGNPKT
jgi:hypothetical protein